MSQSQVSLYFNTMVFTVISGIVCLMLLALMFYAPSAMSRFAVLVIVVEIGLLANIIIALYRIYDYEKRMSKLSKNGAENLLAVKTCPDYWTLKEDSKGNVSCNRTYNVPSDDTSESKSVITMQGTKDSFDLASYNGRPLRDVCASVTGLEAPWTDVRTVCNAYKVYM